MPNMIYRYTHTASTKPMRHRRKRNVNVDMMTMGSTDAMQRLALCVFVRLRCLVVVVLAFYVWRKKRAQRCDGGPLQMGVGKRQRDVSRSNALFHALENAAADVHVFGGHVQSVEAKHVARSECATQISAAPLCAVPANQHCVSSFGAHFSKRTASLVDANHFVLLKQQRQHARVRLDPQVTSLGMCWSWARHVKGAVLVHLCKMLTLKAVYGLKR